MLRFLAAVGLLGGLSAAVAQTVNPPAPVVPVDPLPPLTIPAEATVQQLPNGTVVSQPLQPGAAEIVPAKPGVLDPSALPPEEPLRVVKAGPDPTKPFARSWDSAEVLLWWTKPPTLPPLVTTSPVGLPTLGGPYTTVLFGGRSQDPPGSGGGRFVLGWALGAGDRAGYEIGYSFLGTNTSTAPYRGGGNWRGPTFGIPLVNPHTGAEDVVLVSSLAQRGAVDVSQSIRVQGWELTGLVNLYNSPQFKVHALTGYRYFMANEGVRVDTQSAFDPQILAAVNVDPAVRAGLVRFRSASADQFDAHNRFHGGQLGLRSEWAWNGFFAQADTKVSLGRTVEVVKVSGQTVSVADTLGGPAVSYFPGGVFGQGTNSGRFSRSAFAVLPEANVRVGFLLGERSRVFVGYQFLYLSHAVRAADQFDRTVDLTQLQPPNPAALVLPATRPAMPFDRGDFWAQGLSFGLEWRY